MTDDVIEEKFRARDEALHLQAREYERRLDALNGEAERLRQIQALYIPREVFDRTISDLRADIDVLEAAKLRTEGKGQWVQIVPWLLTAVSLLFMWLNYSKK